MVISHLEVELLRYAIGRHVRQARPHDVLDVELVGLVGAPRADLTDRGGRSTDNCDLSAATAIDRRRQQYGGGGALSAPQLSRRQPDLRLMASVERDV